MGQSVLSGSPLRSRVTCRASWRDLAVLIINERVDCCSSFLAEYRPSCWALSLGRFSLEEDPSGQTPQAAPVALL